MEEEKSKLWGNANTIVEALYWKYEKAGVDDGDVDDFLMSILLKDSGMLKYFLDRYTCKVKDEKVYIEELKLVTEYLEILRKKDIMNNILLMKD